MKNLLIILSLLFMSSLYSSAQSIVSKKTHTLCPEISAPQLAISNIVFDVPLGVKVVITQVIPDNSAFDTGLSQNESAGSQVLLKTKNNGPSGVFDVTLKFKIVNTSTILSEVIQVTIANRVSLTTTSASVCNNITDFDLNTLVDFKGGKFTINPGETSPRNGLMNLANFATANATDNSFTYDYLYTDQHGCSYYSSGTTVQLLKSPKITLVDLNETDCFDNEGEIYTLVNSPNGPFLGSWSNGVQNSDSIIGLSAGDYYYSVEDNLGCKDQLSAIVETDDFEIISTISDVLCKGGSDGEILIDMPEGSGGYEIAWSSGHTQAHITGLSAGTYSVNVTDTVSGCITFAAFEVGEPEYDFVANFSVSRASTCTEEDASVVGFQAGNGDGPFTFLWSNGGTSDYIINMSPGSYWVEVTDSNGCVAKEEFNLNALVAPNAYVELIDPSCGEDNGAIHLLQLYPNTGEEITGYSWSNGSVTRHLNDLNEGEYTVSISQSDGCVGIYNYTLNNKDFNYAPEICIVTVDTATNTNLVVWEKEAGNPNGIDYYNIYRANATTGEYQIVGSVNYSSISVFNDVVASPERRSWKYKISAVNTCGQESRLSQRHKTIHLVMNSVVGQGTNVLTWDHYEGLEYFYYNLYRGTDLDGWQLVQGNIGINGFPIVTDVYPVGSTGVDYIVEVVPTSGGCTATYTKAQDYNSSRSNRPKPIFDPGFGTGDPSNDLVSYENDEFKALVYPNPSNGDFKIEITDNIGKQNLEMTLMGMNGNVIHQQRLNNDLNTVQLNLDAGLYFVQIQGESTLETIRVVIQ